MVTYLETSKSNGGDVNDFDIFEETISFGIWFVLASKIVPDLFECLMPFSSLPFALCTFKSIL